MNKHGRLKKLTAVLLALVLVMGSMGTVFATPITSGNQPGSIEVTGGEADKNMTISAYKLMDVNFDDDAKQPQDPEFVWVDAVGEWIVGTKDNPAGDYSAYATLKGGQYIVTKAFNSTAVKGDDAKAFYDALAAAIRGNVINLTATKEVQTTNGAATIEDLKMANYLLIVEGGVKIYAPAAVNVVPEWNSDSKAWVMTTPTAEVNLKAETTTIQKGVSQEDIAAFDFDKKEETLAIGDDVYFGLNAKVPAFPNNAIKEKFYISDTLPEGLTLDTTSIVVKGWTSEEVNLTELNHDNKYYKLKTVDAKRPDTQADVSFLVDFKYDEIKAYSEIRVYYTAKLNEKATLVKGEENNAYLIYSNNPYGDDSYETANDKTKVFTYGIDLTKVEKGTNNTLPGAVFKLSKTNGGDALDFVKVTDGNYRLAMTADTTKTKDLVVGANGKLIVTGLDAEKTTGTDYFLTETKAPDEYALLNGAVKVTIIAGVGENGRLDGTADYYVGNKLATTTDALVKVTVENNKHFTLPITGGMGTVLFTAAGILIMGTALAMLFFRRKRA